MKLRVLLNNPIGYLLRESTNDMNTPLSIRYGGRKFILNSRSVLRRFYDTVRFFGSVRFNL